MEAEFGPLSAKFRVLDMFAVRHVILWVERFRRAFRNCGEFVGCTMIPTGAKARIDVDVLRGAEAPLFHVSAGVDCHCRRSLSPRALVGEYGAIKNAAR